MSSTSFSKVLLIGNYSLDQQQSMNRFGGLLHSGLHERGIDVEMLKPQPLAGRMWFPGGRFAKLVGYVDKFILFPRILRGKLAELREIWGTNLLVHICDQANAVYVPDLKPLAHLVTCHDLLAIRSALGEFPGYPTRVTGKLYQRWILHSLRQMQFAVCVSNATRRDLARLAGIPAERVAVIKNCLNYPYKPIPHATAAALLQKVFDRTRYLRPSRYFLSLGHNSWYKNRHGLLRVYELFADSVGHAPALVFAGKPLSTALKSRASAAGLKQRVIDVGGLSNEELNAFYCCADALIFPSIAEGFGWPVIEAQAAGCPVIASNIETIVENGGEGVVYIDPSNDLVAAATLRSFFKCAPHERESKVRSGLANAAKYSKDTFISGYLSVYDRLLASKGTSQYVEAVEAATR